MDFIIVINGVYVQGVKYRFFKSHNFRKITGFGCGYGCIKCNKTDDISSILIKLSTLVVKILLKHKISKVLYFWVKKVVFEQLNCVI